MILSSSLKKFQKRLKKSTLQNLIVVLTDKCNFGFESSKNLARIFRNYWNTATTIDTLFDVEKQFLDCTFVLSWSRHFRRKFRLWIMLILVLLIFHNILQVAKATRYSHEYMLMLQAQKHVEGLLWKFACN